MERPPHTGILPEYRLAKITIRPHVKGY